MTRRPNILACLVGFLLVAVVANVAIGDFLLVHDPFPGKAWRILRKKYSSSR